MGFMDELKKLARPYADEEDDFDDDFDVEERAPRASRASTAPRMNPRTSFDDMMDDSALTSGRSAAASNAAAPRRTTDSKVVNINATTQLQVVLVKPDRFDTVSEIAEHLRSRHAVVLNLEATNKDIARRVVDFLSGCAYALDGKIKKIAISTYIITPYNMEIVGDVLDELENSNLYQ